jgi:predicted amidohydrolase YtcJ
MAIETSLILTNGNLLTQDGKKPHATAMAIAGDRIAAVASDKDVAALATPQTQRMNLEGKTVVPGFCDCHIHLYMHGAHLLRQVDLTGSRDIAEILQRLSDFAKKRPVGWIQGYGFDQSKLKENRFPTRQELDRVSNDRPMIISRICGHATVVNSAALAQVTADERAAGDEQSGLYTEGDSSAFYRRIPPLNDDEAEEAVLLAANEALETGITSVQTLLDRPEQMSAYARLRAKGKLPMRIVGMPPYDAVAALHAHGINSTFGDDWLRFGAAKFFSDGSLGAQTAWLKEPYADKPETRGIRIYDPEDLKQKCRDAQAKGFQIAIHAIGDEALRESLDAIDYALNGADNAVHRHRVEHASVTPRDCLGRMAKKKICVTAQPQFVTSDTWTGDRLGPERTPWAYPFRSMIRAGIPVGLSSDCPVEKLDAFDCLAAAVGRHEWTPDETLTVEEALYAYTMGSAYCAHTENRQGSLTAGKLADFVVLSDDPTKVSAAQIRSIKAEKVFVAGRLVQR